MIVRVHDLINLLLGGKGNYLEIGCGQSPYAELCNFKDVRATLRVGVDPHCVSPASFSGDVFYTGSSDDYFSDPHHNPILNQPFDVVFIDGLHHSDQVLRDIVNAYAVTRCGGWIVCHDCYPLDPTQATREHNTYVWMGDCYRAAAWIVGYRSEIESWTIPLESGCFIMYVGSSDLVPPTKEDFDLLLDLPHQTIIDYPSVVNYCTVDQFLTDLQGLLE